MDCFAALAMTLIDMVRILAALTARGFHQLHALSERKGAGKAGCRLHPRSCTKCTSRPQGNRITRLSPRGGLRAYTRPPRGAQLFSPRRPGIDDAPKPGRAGRISQDLAPDRGARTPRLCRPRPSPLNAPPGLVAQAKFWRKRLA